MKTNATLKVLPVLFGFFIMGFVDVVGISTSYVKQDFNLSDKLANLLPMMVFFWFLVFSVPTGLMMNAIGRKKTVLISMVLTFVAMILGFMANTFALNLVAFAMLGIGNTILQVSLNPLLTNVVKPGKLTSSLTWGQFIKAIASFLGPIIAAFSAKFFGDWKMIFMIFAATTVVSGIWLLSVPIKEEGEVKTSTFFGCFRLLGNRYILLFFMGILFVVGVDVGLNTTVPKFLMERCNIPLEEAGFGTSLYFIARTAGTFLGAILLARMAPRKFFIINMFVAIVAMSAMLFMSSMWLILTFVFIVGFAVANVFSIIFSAALQEKPDNANEISGLMIMGVSGGAVVLPIMGMVSDYTNQGGALAVLTLLIAYLLFVSFKMKKA
jgi:MFS transporter, FHS family, L-fucose permease